MQLRNAQAADLEALTKIWYDGWQDAHADLVPIELKRLRTFDSFRDRLSAALPRTRVAELEGEVVGFCILKDDELYQLFLSAPARGTGIAAALVADAETRLKEAGVETAWLGCAIGNQRAARFYEKQGWRCSGEVAVAVETTQGPFELNLWRYEKALGEE